MKEPLAVTLAPGGVVSTRIVTVFPVPSGSIDAAPVLEPVAPGVAQLARIETRNALSTNAAACRTVGVFGIILPGVLGFGTRRSARGWKGGRGLGQQTVDPAGASAGSRTRINGFGGHYTIHCATLASAVAVEGFAAAPVNSSRICGATDSVQQELHEHESADQQDHEDDREYLEVAVEKALDRRPEQVNGAGDQRETGSPPDGRGADQRP